LKHCYKILVFFTLFGCSSNPLFSQLNIGIWKGTASQGQTVYAYSLNINKIKNDSIYGTTISSSKNFYSETKFRGISNGNVIQLIETELVKTNYKGTGSVCLMKLSLTKRDNKLEGNFTSSNKDIKDCGSGIISLNLIKEKKATPSPKQETASLLEEQSPPKKETILVSQPERKNLASTVQAPLQISNQRKIDKREIDLLNTFQFVEDSVMIKIYDNGVIDGDVISLIINGIIVFDKVKLTASPLTYALKSSNSSQFQIECYADNLGEIPPNTGLITISSATKTSEILFSSDLKKSAAIKVMLKNFP
jgi:hypothetical protein